MDDQYNSYWELENFLKGELDSDGSRMIEEKLNESTAFANKVNAHRIANELIIDNGLLELKNQMVEWKRGKNPGSGFSKGGKIISMIIVVTSLSLIAYFTSFKSKPIEILPQKTVTENVDNALSEKQQNEKPLKLKAKSLPPLKIIKSHELKNILNLEIQDKHDIKKVNDRTLPDNEISKLPLKLLTNSNHKIQLPIIPASKTEDKIGCYKVKPFYTVQKIGSCNGQYNGSIVFDKVQEQYGNSFYTYSIDAGNSFAQSSSFENLANGEYKLAIKDKKGCIYTSEEIVELYALADCNISKEIAFCPGKGETWIPNIKEDEGVSLKIFDNSGRSIFNKNIYQGFEWDGKSNNGSDLSMGSYLYVLSFKNGEILTSHITILQ